MSNHFNAPATKMLATNCACCGLPLVDAKSVELGIGPICREKHGFDLDVAPGIREAANKIVYQIALLCLNAKSAEIPRDVFRMTDELADLGFGVLAGIIEARAAKFAGNLEKKAAKKAKIRIEVQDGRYFVRVPYSPEFNAATAHVFGRKGKKVEVEGKKKPVFFWTFPVTKDARKAIWKALCAEFAGQTAVGPKGVFTVAEAA